jgi:hypothetical protein
VAIAAGASELALAAMACAAAKVALLPLDPLLAEAAWPRLQALAGGRLQRLSPLPDSAYLARAACAPLAAERQRANVTELADALSDAKPADAAATDLALVIATSGSEGEAKAVMLNKANLDAAARAANELPVTERRRLLAGLLAAASCWRHFAALPLSARRSDAVVARAVLGRCRLARLARQSGQPHLAGTGDAGAIARRRRRCFAAESPAPRPDRRRVAVTAAVRARAGEWLADLPELGNERDRCAGGDAIAARR